MSIVPCSGCRCEPAVEAPLRNSIVHFSSRASSTWASEVEAQSEVTTTSSAPTMSLYQPLRFGTDLVDSSVIGARNRCQRAAANAKRSQTIDNSRRVHGIRPIAAAVLPATSIFRKCAKACKFFAGSKCRRP